MAFNLMRLRSGMKEDVSCCWQLIAEMPFGKALFLVRLSGAPVWVLDRTAFPG
jgi:hypothetical protein